MIEILMILAAAMFGSVATIVVIGGLLRLTSTTDELVIDEYRHGLMSIVDFVDLMDDDEIMSHLQNIKMMANQSLDFGASFKTTDRQGVILLEMVKDPSNPVTIDLVLQIGDCGLIWPDDFDVPSIAKAFRRTREKVKP